MDKERKWEYLEEKIEDVVGHDLEDTKGWNRILTISQQNKLIEEGIEALKKLVNSSYVKDILKPITIGNYSYVDSHHHFRYLYLTNHGLIEKEIQEGEHSRCERFKIIKLTPKGLTYEVVYEYDGNYIKNQEESYSNFLHTYQFTKDSILSFLKMIERKERNRNFLYDKEPSPKK